MNDVFSVGVGFDFSFIVSVKTDALRDRILGDAQVMAALVAAFTETGYGKMAEERFVAQSGMPMPGGVAYMLTIQSKEKVDRDFRGSWFHATQK